MSPQLCVSAGLKEVEMKEITVQRMFASFDDFWTANLLGANIRRTIAAMASDDVELLKMRVISRLNADAAGRITCTARANAIKGRVPM
jgi:hypothetical protein